MYSGAISTYCICFLSYVINAQMRIKSISFNSNYKKLIDGCLGRAEPLAHLLASIFDLMNSPQAMAPSLLALS